MTYTDNLLATVFSANVGDSSAQQRQALDRIASKEDPRQRDGLRQELEAALADEAYDWETLFDRHEVYPDDGTPRQFVIHRIWTPLFGREAVPDAA